MGAVWPLLPADGQALGPGDRPCLSCTNGIGCRAGSLPGAERIQTVHVQREDPVAALPAVPERAKGRRRAWSWEVGKCSPGRVVVIASPSLPRCQVPGARPALERPLEQEEGHRLISCRSSLPRCRLVCLLSFCHFDLGCDSSVLLVASCCKLVAPGLNILLASSGSWKPATHSINYIPHSTSPVSLEPLNWAAWSLN